MFMAIVAALSLVVLSTLIHYEVLRSLSTYVVRLPVQPRAKLVAVIFGTFAGHMLEIVLYAVSYYSLRDPLDLGNFGGHFVDRFSTYLYFSTETYTSIGLGDIYPLGPLRMITGIEALNGLLLIGWSASFTYVAMQRFWRINSRA
jgi:Ion channel